jgi:hypothetical protein
MTRRGIALVVAVTVLAILLPAIVAIATDLESHLGRNLTEAERVALVTVLLLDTGLLLAYLAWHAPTGYGATLQGTVLWLPWTAALASSSLYLASIPEYPFLKDNSLLVGSCLAGALWLIYALVDRDYATASRQSPGWYGLLKGSVAALQLRAAESLAACPGETAAVIQQQVTEHLCATAKRLEEPGLRWVTRAGFNVAWTDYHRADEALISIVPKASLIDVAISDLLRLDGSEIKGRAALQADLQAALKEIDPKLEPYVSGLVTKDPKACADDTTSAAKGATPADTAASTPSTGLCPRLWQCLLALIGKGGAGSRRTPSTDEGAQTDPSVCEAEPISRIVILTIHRSLNTYRGSRWAEFGRARWQLMLTTTVAGMVGFLVLALTLIRGVQQDQLVAGWTYFLVGAAAGLFLRLRLASEESQVSDDYGLEAARVYQTPLLSGMAAVIGVVLMASIAGSSLADVLNPESDKAAAPAAAVSSPATDASSAPAASASPAPSPTQGTTSTISDAFNLGKYPLGLVLALAFGLTPNLVLRRLGVSASNAKDQLLATRPT